MFSSSSSSDHWQLTNRESSIGMKGKSVFVLLEHDRDIWKVRCGDGNGWMIAAAKLRKNLVVMNKARHYI